MRQGSRILPAAGLIGVALAAAWGGCEGAEPGGAVPQTDGADAAREVVPERDATPEPLGSEAEVEAIAEPQPDGPLLVEGEAASPPPDGAILCPWEGWYVSPRMPAGCNGLCVPDDPKLRIPHLTWVSREDWCAGCKRLETPWLETSVLMPKAVGPGIQGHGASPDLVTLALTMGDKSEIGAIFGQDGWAINGWRVDYNQECGRVHGGVFSVDDMVAADFLTGAFDAEYMLIVPASQAATLASSTASSITWSDSFLNHRAPNEFWFSSSTIAMDLMGHMAIGRIKTGQTFLLSDLDAGPQGGQTGFAQVTGDAVFFDHFDGQQSDWWVYNNDSVRPFLGGADVNIRLLATDGQWLVWHQGTQPYIQNGQKTFSRYDLYWSPYTTDAASLQPKLLLANTTPDVGEPTMRNGYFAAMYHTHWAPDTSAAIVVRMSDGKAWRSILPEGYSWCDTQYPASDELWGPATKGALGNGQTVVRVPYSSMEVIQAGFPDGG